MSNIAIRAVGLGKRYRIGVQRRGRTLLLTDVLERVRDRMRGRFSVSGEHPGHQGSNHFWALRDVSFDVERGDVVGVIGGNGSGKSTLLKILARITDPTVGFGEMQGRVASLLEVGTGFHPELTGRENVYLNGAILGMKRGELGRKFDEIVGFSGIEKFLDTPVKHYSSGMYVRLAFAVAAHLEPDILLVDEVLAVGDASFQRKCLVKMQEIAKQGRTVLFVTHNMAFIRSLCSWCLELEGGTVVASGEPEKISVKYEARALEMAQEHRQVLPIVNSMYEVSLERVKAEVSRAGSHANLSLELTLKSPRFDRVRVGVSVFTGRGDLVAKLGPRLTDAAVELTDGEGNCVLACEDVDRFLASGEYWMSLRFVAGGRLVLSANRVVSFHVPECDPFGTHSTFTLYEDGLVPLPLKPQLLSSVEGAEGEREPRARDRREAWWKAQS